MMFDLMNTELGSLLNRARTIKSGEIWMSVFRDQTLKNRVLEWIQQDQLFEKGVDENNTVIGTYSEATEMMNPSKIAGEHYTLFDTGDFYDSMYIVVLKDSIIIEADGLKTDENGETTDLIAEFGDGILGLTEENKTKLAQELIERYVIEAERLLYGNR